MSKYLMILLTLFRMWGGGGGGAKIFFPITPPNVETCLQNFLTFSFNLLPHCCDNSSFYLVPVPNY